MKVVLDENGIGMKVVLDESGFGMKVVLDENFRDEKRHFHQAKLNCTAAYMELKRSSVSSFVEKSIWSRLV